VTAGHTAIVTGANHGIGALAAKNGLSARVSRQYPADIVQGIQVPDGNPQRHRGGHLPARLHPPGVLIPAEFAS
jgi:hypothetical protein